MRSPVRQGLFLRIEEFSRRRYRTVFLAALLLVLLSVFLSTRLSLDGDVMNLVPRTNRTVNTFREALADFGNLDSLLLLVRAREGQGVEELQDFADRVAARLQQVPQIRWVEHKIDTSGPFFSFFRTHQILFLPPEKLEELAAKLGDRAIEERVKDNLRQLTGPSSFFVKQWLEQDPFQISELLFKAVLGNKGPLKVDLSSGYYLSNDGSALLLIARPTHPAQDLDFDRELMLRVRAAVRAASVEFEEDLRAEGDGTGRAPEVDYGGGYMIALEDAGLITQDIKWTASFSFVLILGLYYFCYRRFAALLYSSVPLLVGQILTYAVAYVFLRNLNSATVGLSAMLMGLGTDFTIVMYARYVEERGRGHSLTEALRRMMGSSAFGVFTGAITSAGTFYSMCVTEFKGLRDFGFLVGSGILLCLVSILFLMPAMIAFNDGRARKTDVTRKLYLHSFGIERVMTWSTRHPWPVAIASALLTLLLGFHASRLEYSDNVQELRSPNNRGVKVQEEIAAKFGANFTPMMVVCRAGDLDGLMERNREANRILEGFVGDGTLLGYESLFSYLPPRVEQEQVIAALRAGAGGTYDVGRIEKTFRAALRRNGFREEIYDPYLRALPATLRPEKPVTLDDLEAAGLDRFVSRYVRRDPGGGYRSVAYLFPASPEAKRRAPPALVRALDRPRDGIEISGPNMASAELRRTFKRDAWRAVLLGLAVVTVLLWLDFRSIWLTILANIQLLSGVVWMIGIMRLMDIKMNFVNSFVTTIILGVGIDYGIHIIHRIGQEGLANPAGLLETGKAVVMASLTNVAGFGTLALSNYPGMASMGQVCAIGSLTCLATTLTLLPALMILTHTRMPAPPGGPDTADA